MFLRKIWRRITTSRRTREREAEVLREKAERESALRDEFARRTHALESQIAQAHAENCRLRSENRALLNSVLGIAGIPPVIVADPLAVLSDSRHSERSEEPLFVSPGRLGAQSKRDPSGKSGPQDDEAADADVAPNGTASPSTLVGRSSGAPLQKQSGRTGAQKDPHVIAPIRRRSWHQIYRMLEFESSRRKDQDT